MGPDAVLGVGTRTLHGEQWDSAVTWQYMMPCVFVNPLPGHPAPKLGERCTEQRPLPVGHAASLSTPALTCQRGAPVPRGWALACTIVVWVLRRGRASQAPLTPKSLSPSALLRRTSAPARLQTAQASCLSHLSPRKGRGGVSLGRTVCGTHCLTDGAVASGSGDERAFHLPLARAANDWSAL
jgi:hypothetical protein